jgi:PAS domain S-box-containing protein
MNDAQKGRGKPVKERKEVREEIVALRMSATEHKWAKKELQRYRNSLESVVKGQIGGLARASSQRRGKIAEPRRVDEELSKSKKLFDAVFESASEGILLADIRTKKFVYGNRTISRMLGYNLDEIRSLGIADIHPKEDLPYVLDKFEKFAQTEVSSSEGLRVQRKDGSVFYADITSYRMRVGAESYATGIFRDVTERELMEEVLRASEQRFRALVETTSDFVWEVDQNCFYTYANPRIKDLLGYEPEEVIGKTPFDLMPPDEAERIAKLFSDIAKSGKCFAALEHAHLHKDGRRVVLETSGVPISDAPGNLAGYRGIDRDITERKQAEEALRASEQRFRALVETTSDFVWEVDQNGFYTYASPKIKDLLGYEPEEVIGKTPFDLMPPDEAERIAKVFWAIAESRKAFTALENTNLHKDGRRVVLETSGVPILDAKGNLVGYRGIDRDITKRKRAKEELAMQARIAAIFVTVPDDEMFNEVLKVVLDVTHSPFGVFGYLDETGASIVPTMTRQIWDKCQIPRKTIRFPQETWGDSSWPRAIREKKANYTNEVSTKPPEGHITITRHVSLPILFHEEVIGLFQVANRETDYTEADICTLQAIADQVAPLLSARLQHKQAEEKLRESEGKFRAIFDNTSDGIFLLDLKARKFFMCNATCATMLGYTQEEFSNLDIADIHPGEDLPFIYEQIGKFSRGEEGIRSDIRFKPKDGSIFVADLSPARLTIADTEYLLISFRDITERKRVEESLWEKERAIESSINGIAMSDLEGNLTYVNAACLKLWGYASKAEVLGRNVADFWVWPEEIREFVKAAKDREGWFGESTAKRKDGSTFEVEASVSRVVDKTGKPLCLLAALVDITEQKRAEENYRSIFENAVVGIYQSTPEGRFLAVNSAFARIFGYKSPQEIINMGEGFAEELYVRRDERKALQQLLEQHAEVQAFDCEAYRRDGAKIWVRDNARAVRDSKGRLAYYEGFLRDITVEKQAAECIIEAQEAERKRVARALHDGVSQLLSSARFRLASAGEKIFDQTQKSYSELEDSCTLIEKAVEEIKRIIQNLRPAALDDLGLLPALRTLCKEFMERTNTTLNFRATPNLARFGPAIELAVFRIVQEALNNIEKHSRATRASVSIVQKEASLQIKVKDNGSGFDPVAACGKQRSLSGYGLHSMRERAAAIGGEVEIRSAIGRGTEVIVRVPLNESGKCE